AQQVALQLRLVDLDAGDLDAALEPRPLAAGQGHRVVLEAAAEGGDAVVGDREVDRGVDGVDGPGARRDLLVEGLGAHRGAFLFRRLSITNCRRNNRSRKTCYGNY